MNRTLHCRRSADAAPRVVALVAALCLTGPVLLGGVRTAAQQAPAPIERRTPSPRNSGAVPSRAAGGLGHRGPQGEHLAEWMNQHSSLSPQQQQQALDREPGFRELPAQTQQRMRDRLAQLDAMPPARRQRVIARTEAMERLSPEQRGEVRGALGQLGSLPMEQRHEVAHTFRALRDLPPSERVQAYSSGRYGPPLSDTQRSVLMNLLRVEPMLPPPANVPAAPHMPPMGQALR